jgi:Protein of unknown function (DUF3105)
MPKKRRRARSRPRATPSDSAARRPGGPRSEVPTRPERREPVRPGPASRSRAEKKELARQARERAVKTVRRRQATRRAIQVGVVAALAVGVFLFLTRVSGPGDIPEGALQAAQAAGCDDVETPVSGTPDRTHLDPGEPFTYDQQPAVAGAHDSSPLPPQPHVYDAPVEETRAVHNLEHAYVLIYYRAQGREALPADVVRDLEGLARSEEKVIMAPYPSLQDGTALALAAWNKLWECPSGITVEQARTVASGFIDAYKGTSNAPEANVP